MGDCAYNNSVRKYSFLFRYGGEVLGDEFVEREQSSVAVSWIAGDKGCHIADRYRKGVADVFDEMVCKTVALYLTAIPIYFLGKTYRSSDFLQDRGNSHKEGIPYGIVMFN